MQVSNILVLRVSGCKEEDKFVHKSKETALFLLIRILPANFEEIYVTC